MPYFEELPPGSLYESPPRVVREADVQAFAELSGDRGAIHLDDAAARAAGFDGRIAHGALGISIATGLVSALGITKESLIALIEISWRFVAPIAIGDTVRAVVRVAERRETSRADRGVVTFDIELVNGAGGVVQRGRFVELVRRRPAA